MRGLVPAVLLALTVGLVAEARMAHARPGGGQSYSGSKGGSSSGGSSRSSGSSSSGSSSGSSRSSSSTTHSSGQGVQTATPATGLEIALFGFVFGTFCLIFLAVAISSGVEKLRKMRGGYSENWESRAPPPLVPEDPWAGVRALDPDFSAVLFDDFVYALYAAAHRARHDPAALDGLGPYLTPKVRVALHQRMPLGAPCQAVVVGALRLVRVIAPADAQEHRVVVEIESNVTVASSEGPRGEYLKERWTLSRAPATRTRASRGIRTFECPACGAPFVSSADARCASCGQVVGNGRFDWRVIAEHVLESDARPPALTVATEERGTGAPTVVDAGLATATQALVADDPSFTEEGLFRRIDTVFAALHAAWAAQDLRPIRPHVTDAMFNYLSYWVDAYRGQGLRNAVEGARLTRRQRAKVARDRHFDALTVRLWATGHEVTTEAATGNVVSGSRQRERPYSEYWTLIRGASVRGAARVEPTCPSCGAPLDVNMAGSCEHCGVHVTSGEFDWVLSRIEQDDSYQG